MSRVALAVSPEGIALPPRGSVGTLPWSVLRTLWLGLWLKVASYRGVCAKRIAH